MKKLPPELVEWYFPFNWDVKEVWDLEGRLEQRSVRDLEWHLEMPLWSTEAGRGMLFDLRPRDVLAAPEIHRDHARRMAEADESYPACVAEFRGREIIVDGIHRLAKLVGKGTEVMEVKLMDEASIRSIARYD